MPRFVVASRGEHWDAVRASLAELSRLASGGEVDLNDVGKGLSRLVIAVRAAFDDAGLPSVRLKAAVRALDLKTPKSALEAFVGSPAAPDPNE